MNANRQPRRKEIADFKRLVELCMADPVRRDAFFAAPECCMKEWGLTSDLSITTDAMELFFGRKEGKAASNLYLRSIQKAIDEIHADYARETTLEKISNERFRAWYQRKISGYLFTSRFSRAKEGLFYMPVLFELSEGCSVGCNFCCLAAERLKQNFAYTEENRRLWKDILQITREEIGDIVGMCVCYFATEPFDNPEYERFLADFYRMFGRYPQTTTAVLQRDIQRTKRFLDLLGENALRKAALRGSIVSLEQLDEIHKAFTSEELEYVELLPNNPESVFAYSRAGRSIALSETLGEEGFTRDASSVCICGFVINLVKKTILLAAPYRPDDQHPLGMKIYDERSFQDGPSYRQRLREMMENRMPLMLPEDQPLHPVETISWQRRGYRLKIIGDGISRSISLSDQEYRCFLSLAERRLSLQEIYKEEQLTQFQQQQLGRKIQILYDGGCLEEIEF